MQPSKQSTTKQSFECDIQTPHIINDLSLLEANYDAFIFDLWGVIHDGFKPYAGVLNYLEHLKNLGKCLLFLSNAPRPASVLIQKLLSFGLSVTPEMLLSSGDVVIEQLKYFNDSVFKTLGKRLYHLGRERNQDILAGLSVNVVNNLKDANFILLTAYIDIGEDLNQYNNLLISALNLKLPMICANPDKEIMNGDKLRYCAGVLAEKFEKMGGIVHYYGKPYLAIYKEAFKRLHTKGIIDKKRILMIGDTLETDIRGAKNAGIDSALMLTGNMDLLLKKHNLGIENVSMTTLNEIEINAKERITFLTNLFKQYQVKPQWILPNFNLFNNLSKKNENTSKHEPEIH